MRNTKYQLLCMSTYFMGSIAAFLGIPDFLRWGTCNQIEVQEDFDVTKYQGAWWDTMAVPNQYVKTKSCAIMNYQQDCYSLNVSTTGLDKENNKVQQMSMLNPGKHLGDMIVDAQGVPSAPFQVLETDYRNYSCVYSCLGYAFVKVEFMWVFSRTPELSSEDADRCISVFDKYGIDSSSLKDVKQGKGCPYYDIQADIITYNKVFLDEIFELNYDNDTINSDLSHPKTLPSSLPDYCIRPSSASYKYIPKLLILLNILLTSQLL